jgi:hypothetical protein
MAGSSLTPGWKGLPEIKADLIISDKEKSFATFFYLLKIIQWPFLTGLGYKPRIFRSFNFPLPQS